MHTRVALLFLVLGVLMLPLVLAQVISLVGGVGTIELALLYGLCAAGAYLIWRSMGRRKAKAN